MKVEKIESYPPLTTDEQETVLTWDAKERAWHICTDYPAHAYGSNRQEAPLL